MQHRVVGIAMMIGPILLLSGCGGVSGPGVPTGTIVVRQEGTPVLTTIPPPVPTTPGPAATTVVQTPGGSSVAPPPGPGTPVPGGQGNAEHYQGKFFAAWLPKGWAVLNETGNGIDIATPKKDGVVSFGYVTNGPGSSTPRAFRQFWFQTAAIGDAKITREVDMGNMTDTLGIEWSFLLTEYDATSQGQPVHTRMTIGVGNAQAGSFGAMVSSVSATVDQYRRLVGALSAVERSIILTKLAGSSSRNPTTDQNNGYWSRDRSQARLSKQWEETTLGVVFMHSPETGQHFDVPINDFWDTGPDGPGYYRQRSDGSYEKLEPDEP